MKEGGNRRLLLCKTSLQDFSATTRSRGIVICKESFCTNKVAKQSRQSFSRWACMASLSASSSSSTCMCLRQCHLSHAVKRAMSRNNTTFKALLVFVFRFTDCVADFFSVVCRSFSLHFICAALDVLFMTQNLESRKRSHRSGTTSLTSVSL